MSAVEPVCNTVTLYKITVTKACTPREKGTYFSLTPWTGNNRLYEGHDDGGAEYFLPPGFHVARSMCGEMEIYNAQDIRHTVGKVRGRPCIAHPIGAVVAMLKKKPRE